MINENFLESDLGGEENREIISDASDKLVNEEIELVKPIMDEFESNVDEEEQDQDELVVDTSGHCRPDGINDKDKDIVHTSNIFR